MACDASNVGDGDPCPCTGNGFFPILCQAAAAAEPCEGALDHPTAGHDFEAIGGVGAPDDLDGPAPDGLQGVAQFGARISAIGKDMAQPGVARGDGFEDIRRTVAIPQFRRYGPCG